MAAFKKVDERVNFPQMEDRITAFWKEHDIFQKSVDQRPDDDRYKFVDGPPFVTGNPHYGSLLPSIAKDVIPRYWTMKGKKVRRVWGWDCHGLPIEEKVNKKLGIKSSAEIENRVGVDAYIDACKEYIKTCTSDWRWYIDKIGRWVDMDHAYYTMSTEYMESVIWGFKQIYDKGLIYKGKRVSMFSTDTSTPVSQFEVAMDADNYKDVEDLSVFVKFPLQEKNPFNKTEPVYMVAWTTTPWTIPANFALAVNEKADYCLVKYIGEYFIVAKDRVAYTFGVHDNEVGTEPDMAVQICDTFKGKKLDGLAYEPVYTFFEDKKQENDFHVYISDDVVLDEGTGVLHIAPAFGEVDFNFGLKHELSAIPDIDEAGKMTLDPWVGIYLRDASPLVAEDMQQKERLLRSLPYTHRLPFYRGENPLIYMAQDAYFINIQKIKDRMLELNQELNWIPEYIKDGRFAQTVATSPDWCISRNRFWATIMPIWVNEDGDEIVIGSIAELLTYTDQVSKKEVNGKVSYFFENKPFDLHKDVGDKIVLKKDGKEYHRVPEVLDCWMDSGSVPFAEYHYPFENKEVYEQSGPADYIIEYIGQVRAWFNVLLRLSTIIFDDTAFKNVICTGVLAGNDGRKMSKSYGNYPDPKEVLEHIGGEALRLYMMGSPIMVGDDMNWSDELLKEQIKNVLLPIWNTYKYLVIYANVHNWTPKTTAYTSSNPLDIWVREYMLMISKEYASRLEAYNIPSSVKLAQEAIDGISSWFIRRSRERFAEGDTDALQTLYAVMVQYAKTFAPQMPFLTEEIYQNLVVGAGLKEAKESVHLEFYPDTTKEINTKILESMAIVRKLSSLGQSIRVTNSLKVRQPLASAIVPIKDEDMQEIIKDELNVKEVIYSQNGKVAEGFVTQSEDGEAMHLFVTLDTRITPELKEEGMLREIIRYIQSMRKDENLKMDDKIHLVYFSDNQELTDLVAKNSMILQKAVNASSVKETGEQQGKPIGVDDKILYVSFS